MVAFAHYLTAKQNYVLGTGGGFTFSPEFYALFSPVTGEFLAKNGLGVLSIIEMLQLLGGLSVSIVIITAIIKLIEKK